MNFSEEGLKNFSSHVARFLRTCPLCGGASMSGSLAATLELAVGTPEPGKPRDTLPLLPITCTICGHTELINLLVAGALVPPPAEAPATEPPPALHAVQDPAP